MVKLSLKAKQKAESVRRSLPFLVKIDGIDDEAFRKYDRIIYIKGDGYAL